MGPQWATVTSHQAHLQSYNTRRGGQQLRSRLTHTFDCVCCEKRMPRACIGLSHSHSTAVQCIASNSNYNVIIAIGVFSVDKITECTQYPEPQRIFGIFYGWAYRNDRRHRLWLFGRLVSVLSVCACVHRFEYCVPVAQLKFLRGRFIEAAQTYHWTNEWLNYLRPRWLRRLFIHMYKTQLCIESNRMPICELVEPMNCWPSQPPFLEVTSTVDVNLWIDTKVVLCASLPVACHGPPCAHSIVNVKNFLNMRLRSHCL